MENLKTLRTENKLTQAKMAKILGIARSTYTQYETDVSEPNRETILKISDYFKVPVSFILGAKPFENWNQIQKYLPAIVFAIKTNLRAEDPFKKFGISDEGKPLNKLIIFLSSFVDHIDIDEKTNTFHIYYFIDDKKTQKNKPASEEDRLRAENNELFDQLPTDKKQQALDYLKFLVEHENPKKE